jgi:ABC-2 type transport system permease protein
MAVYEHSYKPYAGPLTPKWSRLLIIPRHAYRDVFSSKIFTGFFALCFVAPLVMAILIYLHHNATALAIFRLDLRNLVPINRGVFNVFFSIQSGFAFLLTVIIGPVLVSRDLTNNALPLYLCRPFSRTEYLAGKMSVLAILISLITWVPLLLLFLFNSYLDGAAWFVSNIRIAAAVFVMSWVTIAVYSLLAMTLSAWVKWRMAASAGLFGLFVISNAVGMTIDGLFRTNWGGFFNLTMVLQTIQYSLFLDLNALGLPQYMILPTPAAWTSLALLCGMCLLLLSRKVRAYEVVK